MRLLQLRRLLPCNLLPQKKKPCLVFLFAPQFTERAKLCLTASAACEDYDRFSPRNDSPA